VTTYIWLGFLGLILLLIGGAFLYGRRSGKDAIAADVAEETADILRKQDKAATAAASEDVVDRLRKGGF
jgi:LPXTG-motif cell wall-anchored protein